MAYTVQVFIAEETPKAVELLLDREDSPFVSRMEGELFVAEAHTAYGLLAIVGSELLGKKSYDYVVAMLNEARAEPARPSLRIQILKG